MSPLEIEILLHYSWSPRDYRDGDFSAPAVREAIDQFSGPLRLLEPSVAGARMPSAAYVLSDRGLAYVKALTAMPLPVCVWTIPSHSQGTGDANG